MRSAAKVHYDGYLSRIARDLKTPSPQLARAVDSALGAEGRLAALRTVGEERSLEPGTREEDEDEMERRTLLQALAALGLPASPISEALRNIRISVHRTVGGGEDGHIDEWDEIVVEYGHLYVPTPPRRLLLDLASDLVTVQQIIKRKQQEDARRNRAHSTSAPWSRVAAELCALMAKTLSNLGRPREAREWWRTAQSAAEASGDTDLALWIAGGRLAHGLYERRPAAVLLARADKVLERVSDAPSRGLLHVRGVRAQLLAPAGDADEATAELQMCGEMSGTLPPSITSEVHSIAGWAEDRLRYIQAWVHAHLGEREQLDGAVEHAHRVVAAEARRFRAQFGLLQAFGHVRAGDVSGGVRLAHVVYSRQPVEHRTTMVTSLAEQVLEAVPLQRSGEQIVTDYRELLAGSGRKAIT
ncbi:hypothetical protein [Actinomadura keratinilytica]|jgi:hypothetical protein|uniref:XRE family transcriptional regulator n=1 Tax=Actinomadura keratinilytica TaxID=547461 RepID=A0ABP7YYI0_9ACTN